MGLCSTLRGLISLEIVNSFRFSQKNEKYETRNNLCVDLELFYTVVGSAHFAEFTIELYSCVHQVWPKPSCKAQGKEEEDKAHSRRGGNTTFGNGEAWSSASPRGQCRTDKMEESDCEIICCAPTILAV